LTRIARDILIRASKETVWGIISDLDNESEYWYGTKEVKVLSKHGETIRREITQNFRNHRIIQEVILHSSDSIEIFYLKGLTEGKKVMTIEQVTEGSQRLRVIWSVHFTGIYRLATPIIARHTSLGTEHALERIRTAAESLEKKLREESRKPP
jgi:Polyketide cyclase / dehydrase and lipid transport